MNMKEGNELYGMDKGLNSFSSEQTLLAVPYHTSP